MFTGIVEFLGEVKKIEHRQNLVTVTLLARGMTGARPGDSIALDGVCLTVTSQRGSLLTFDVMKETIAVTTLKNLRIGQKINLERALQAGSRFSGHFVTGHVDGTGVIRRKVAGPNYVEFQMTVPRGLARYFVAKGSVCLDGVSLTVGKARKNLISVYLIPYTLRVTNWGTKKAGDQVNVEADILAKYVLSVKS